MPHLIRLIYREWKVILLNDRAVRKSRIEENGKILEPGEARGGNVHRERVYETQHEKQSNHNTAKCMFYRDHSVKFKARVPNCHCTWLAMACKTYAFA